MATLQENFEKLLKNKRAILAILPGSLLLVLFAFNLAGWFFLGQFEKTLEAELGERLKRIAGLSAKIIEKEIRRVEQGSGFDDLALALSQIDDLPERAKQLILQDMLLIQEENQLEALHIVDLNFVAFISLPETGFKPGETIPYFQEDSTRIEIAVLGAPETSLLREFEGSKFKSGYARIENAYGEVIAVVAAEASADFFAILDRIENGLILGIFLSLTLVLIYGAFTLWVVALFVRLQETMRRQDRLAAMGRMAATVAHEVRNPLGIIKSTAEVLKSLYQKEENELFDFIPSEVDRLNRLVSDFLTFARDKRLDLVDHNLSETVERAISDVEREPNSQKVKISFSTSRDASAVPHNADGIRQVMLNLIRNAVEAMDGAGRIDISIAINGKKSSGEAMIEIKDSGPGLPSAPDKLFEPFFTTKTKGSGLGLAVTQQIIERHNGSITARNTETGGACITLRLPSTQKEA